LDRQYWKHVCYKGYDYLNRAITIRLKQWAVAEEPGDVNSHLWFRNSDGVTHNTDGIEKILDRIGAISQSQPLVEDIVRHSEALNVEPVRCEHRLVCGMSIPHSPLLLSLL
jgi:hypothetical protein